MEETRILNFKDNTIQELSLEELQSTVQEKNANEKPVMGMFHWQFIQGVADMVEKAKLKYEIEPVMAAYNKQRGNEGATQIDSAIEKYGPTSVRSWLLRRVFSRVIISDLEDDFTNTAVAVSFTQQGFQLAYGPNVKICQNQSILGAEKFMSTYAHGKKMPTPERMIEVLGEWLHNFKEVRAKELKMISDMSSHVVPHQEVLEIIGDMTAKRVRKDNAKKFPNEPTIPLNQAHIGKFTETYLEERAKENREFSIWDLYNFATNLYKPGLTDYPLLLSSNSAMSEYLLNRYELN